VPFAFCLFAILQFHLNVFVYLQFVLKFDFLSLKLLVTLALALCRDLPIHNCHMLTKVLFIYYYFPLVSPLTSLLATLRMRSLSLAIPYSLVCSIDLESCIKMQFKFDFWAGSSIWKMTWQQVHFPILKINYLTLYDLLFC